MGAALHGRYGNESAAPAQTRLEDAGGIREMAQGWMNVPLMIESLLGTLLWGLFIVAFSRKVIR